MGRNTGNRVSNAIFGDKWSTPYRVGVNKEPKKSGRKHNTRQEQTPASATSPRRRQADVDRSFSEMYAASMQNNSQAFELARQLIERRDARRQGVASALRKISSTPIPRSEDGLVEMLCQLSVDFSSATAMMASESDDESKNASKTLRNTVFRKYSQVLTVLESRYPDNPLNWSFFVSKWRMFFSRRPWSWLWVVYVIVLVAGSYHAVTYRIHDDIVLVSILWGIPLLWMLAVLISRAIRMRH